MSEGASLAFSGEACAGQLDEALPSWKGSLRPGDEEGRSFDLASLTKVLATSSLLVRYHLQSGESFAKFLRTPLARFLPELKKTPLEDLELQEVWEHRSGLPALLPAFPSKLRAERQTPPPRPEALKRLLEEVVKLGRGAERATLYSDVGPFLLGLFLERAQGKSLREQFKEFRKEHGLSATQLEFGPRPGAWPTEVRHPAGEVNDDNAWYLSGVGPHAGLFGCVDDVWAWLRALWAWKKSAPLDEWLTPRPEAERFHCGWDRPARTGPTQAGAGAPPATLGHLGYTGTALWWDPSRGRAAVLLTNRVHPQHSEESQNLIRNLRRGFYTRFWKGKLSRGDGWQNFLNET